MKKTIRLLYNRYKGHLTNIYIKCITIKHTMKR